MKFCPECGSQLPIGTAKFCPSCGKSLWATTSETNDIGSGAVIRLKKAQRPLKIHLMEFQKEKS
jgi:hypothetical protein